MNKLIFNFDEEKLHELIDTFDVNNQSNEFKRAHRDYKVNDRIEEIKSLAEKGDKNATLFYGLYLLFSPENSDSLDWLLIASATGNSDASYALFLLYFIDKPLIDSIKQNQKKAMSFLELALKQNPNNAKALYAYGIINYLGCTLVPVNQKNSFDLFFTASSLGYPPAMTALAKFYYDGIGIPQNRTKAIELLIKSARNYEHVAMGSLYSFFNDEELPPESEEYSLISDIDKEDWYERYESCINFTPKDERDYYALKEEAESGDPESQFEIAVYHSTWYSWYSNKPNIKNYYDNEREEREYLSLAAENNNLDAIYRLALIYKCPDPEFYNPQKSVLLLKKGSELGDLRCTRNLIDVYKNGIPGVRKNPKIAMELLERLFAYPEFEHLVRYGEPGELIDYYRTTNNAAKVDYWINKLGNDIPTVKDGTLYIPEGVISIPRYAFKGNTTIKRIVFPSSIITIGDGAFKNCSELEVVVFPENVSNIGNSSFAGCSKLVNVEFSKNIENIGLGAFFNCNKLRKPIFNNCLKSEFIYELVFD